MSAADEIARRKIETEIDNLAIKERSMFPSGEQWYVGFVYGLIV